MLRTTLKSLYSLLSPLRPLVEAEADYKEGGSADKGEIELVAQEKPGGEGGYGDLHEGVDAAFGSGEVAKPHGERYLSPVRGEGR